MKTKTNSRVADYRTVLIGFLLIVPLISCNFFGVPDYELTVNIKDGVQGTPESGQHSYKELTVVDFKYSPLNSLCTVEVFFEGSTLAAEGTVTMYNNFVLEARLIDIRGTWTIVITNTNTSIAEITYTMSVSGNDVLTGTFSDDRGYSGTWNASGGNIVFKYANWKNYNLKGTLSKMYGTWTADSMDGTWTAVRVN
jgi:hypothetical protein